MRNSKYGFIFVIAGLLTGACSAPQVQVPTGFNSHTQAAVTRADSAIFKTRIVASATDALKNHIINNGKVQGFDQIEMANEKTLVLRGKLAVVGDAVENPITAEEIAATVVLVPAVLFTMVGIPMLDPVVMLAGDSVAGDAQDDHQAKYVSAVVGVIEFEPVANGTQVTMTFDQLVYRYNKGNFDFSALRWSGFNANDYELVSQNSINDMAFYDAIYAWVSSADWQ